MSDLNFLRGFAAVMCEKAVPFRDGCHFLSGYARSVVAPLGQLEKQSLHESLTARA